MEKNDPSAQPKTAHERKEWITPEVFDSPVIAVTEGTPSGSGPDSGTYS